MNANDFNNLDAQSPICALAHVASHEVDETPEYDPTSTQIGNDMSEFDGERDPEGEADSDGEGWPHNDHTGQSDGEALASAGHGTDEDYGCFDGGGEE